MCGMRLKSQLPEWTIAIVYYMIFTVVFLIFFPLGFQLLVGRLFWISKLILGRFDQGVFSFLALAIKILVIGISVWISANLVNRLYNTYNSERVVIFATFYFILMNGAFDLYSSQKPFSLIANLTLFRNFSPITLKAFVFPIIFFYLLSSFFIRSSATKPKIEKA